jgi:MoxR-like ATPase
MIETTCTNCGKKWRTRTKPKQVRCPQCGGRLESVAIVRSVPPVAPPPAVEPAALSIDDLALLATLGERIQQLREEIRRAIVGQDEIITFLLVALLAKGHCLLEGVPGLAKTRIVRSLAKALGLTFKRIQFTPDLMPSDITGTEFMQPDWETREIRTQFKEGPIFGNLILADEINRTPPKTQSALLEAMEEKEVTVANKTMPLPKPFLVMATQNPIEQEGTYPLPEAQQDRFLFKLKLTYPGDEDEREMMSKGRLVEPDELGRVLGTDGKVARDKAHFSEQAAKEIDGFQQLADRIPVPKNVSNYARRLVRATRPYEPGELPVTSLLIDYGAGPRASQALIRGAKSLAAIEGREVATLDDIRHVAMPVLRHRIILKFDAKEQFKNLEKQGKVRAEQVTKKAGDEDEGLDTDVVIHEFLRGKTAAQLQRDLEA